MQFCGKCGLLKASEFKLYVAISGNSSLNRLAWNLPEVTCHWRRIVLYSLSRKRISTSGHNVHIGLAVAFA